MTKKQNKEEVEAIEKSWWLEESQKNERLEEQNRRLWNLVKIIVEHKEEL